MEYYWELRSKNAQNIKALMCPLYMVSCVVVFDGRETRVVYDDTHHGLLGSCVNFSQTAVISFSVSSSTDEG